MGLTQKFVDEFSSTARVEGEKIFQRGDVTIESREAQWITATVNAARPHDTTLVRAKGMVRYSCDCDHYAQTGNTCRHVWATLLAADAKGYTQQWETSRHLELLPEYDEAYDGDDDDIAAPMSIAKLLMGVRPAGRTRRRRPRAAEWKQSLASLRESMTAAQNAARSGWPAGRQVVYTIDVPRTLEGRGLIVQVGQRELRKDGQWGKPKKLTIRYDDTPDLPDPSDREILGLLTGADSARDYFSSYYYSANDHAAGSFRLYEATVAPIVRRMCETGRCMLLAHEEQDARTLAWDTGGTWELWVVARRNEEAEQFILSGELRRGEQRMAISEPAMLVKGGLVFANDLVAPLDDGGAFPWIPTLRADNELKIPAADREELLRHLLTLPKLPKLDLPDELRVEEATVTPRPRLKVRKPKQWNYDGRLRGELSFDYDGTVVSEEEPGRGIYQAERKRLVLRDGEFETQAAAALRSLGFRRANGVFDETFGYELAPKHLPAVIRKLTAENWLVEADGQLYRQPGEIHIEVTSGIDWFELHGAAEFDGQKVALPELLKSLRSGERTVRLDDGTFGVLPEDWLAKYGLLADMGTATEDHIRFSKSQVGVLDALLASQPQATCDAVFQQVRDQMRSFEGVRAADAPAGFVGILRPYQRDGLGWMQFLREFQFGGCLADDMGLGKTVQVLALLEGRRGLRGAAPPQQDSSAASPHPNPLPEGEGAGNAPAAGLCVGSSLVVAPRSLIFNWKEEAAKFAPQLKVLDHTGIGRAKSAESFADYDLILTTYGTLRKDAVFMKDVDFDYVVLDEAQAVKNAASESAKAARLLNGRHRLALSGTPVQNHLGELWSLFEFLNPGMLGTARAFAATGAGARVIDEQTRTLLARALRPFILRRTKQQVARDLPQRVEQTIHCELDAQQRKLYDELREHYRQSLLTRIAREGINRAKIQILEALLRLRQAACHPGLIDKSKTNLGSAKLDSLLAQVTEVLEEDHKVLVFSQFTSFLSIVRQRLDREKITYEYLDGKTRDRAAPVERFQTDPACKLFLISLKAGGLGLNLTAAEYVFLLDPWWNPAVEAQAIDRAHRIGQTRQVFAYRLIAKDTVEEKVLQLQQTKRDLADAIISADNSVISRLGREDLELLLS